jgi:hypothetical protein
MTYPNRHGEVENNMVLHSPLLNPWCDPIVQRINENYRHKEEYDPSLRAIEVSTYQIEHGLEKLDWWWDLTEAQRMDTARVLARCYDEENENG